MISQKLFCRLLILGFLLLRSRNAFSLTAEPESRLDERANLERRWIHDGLYLLPHKPNYFLPFTYNTNPSFQSSPQNPDNTVKKTEMKFQISLKLSLARGVIRNHGDLYFGYTQLSMWQFYDRRASAPFRDTNYEPELFMLFDTDLAVGSMKNKVAGFGFVHQSNGQTDPYSRGWNRLYVVSVLEKNNWVLSIKPWLRIDEYGPDDNPYIEKYMGYGEIRVAHSMAGHCIVSMLLRNNLRFDGNKGAIELGYSFPLGPALRGYVQYFNGYGESLIDYNHPNNRLGIGIALSDWL